MDIAASSLECRLDFVEAQRVASTAPSSHEASAVPNGHPSAGARAGKRLSKKRSRASRRPPTTTLVADSDNFQAMVQQLTGFHSSPFFLSSSSTLQAGNTRLEMLGCHHGLLKPHPTRPEAFPGGQSSIPGLSMIDDIESLQRVNPTSLYPSQADTFREFLQNKQVFPFPFTLKPYASADSHGKDSNHQHYSFKDSHTISPDFKKKLSPYGVQSIGFSNVGALLSPTTESSNVLVDESHGFWDTNADHQSLSGSFDDFYN